MNTLTDNEKATSCVRWRSKPTGNENRVRVLLRGTQQEIHLGPTLEHNV